MCGIAGVWSRAAGEAPVAWEHETRRMLAAIRHRGPDGEGVLVAAGTALGAVRLAITDPEHGAQPMRSPDTGRALAFNGALVNHHELRDELAREGATFRTACDTEVLLELLARRGEAGLARADGMFAFAFLDPGSGDLLLGRDPCGIKPLYWVEQTDRVLFASEPKALLAADGVTARLDRTALLDHLSFQLPLSERTFFEGVRRLPPGTLLRLRRGRPPELVPLPDWQEPAVVADTGDDAGVLRRLLRESVERHLRADVPLGAHLSGGVDSSLVSALAARGSAGRIDVFTGAFDVPGFDERPHARAVAREIGARLHEVVITAADVAEALPAAARAMDEPAGGPGLVAQWCVARHAAQHVKVVLGGQGGDELFAGYVRHLLLGLTGEVRAGRATRGDVLDRHRDVLRGWEPLVARLGEAGWSEPPALAYLRLSERSGGLGGVLSPGLRDELARHPARDRFVAAFEATARGASATADAARFDRAYVLPALLHVEDRTSMAWSLESRVPLLGRAVLSFVDRLDDTRLAPAGLPKDLLRRAAALDLPEAAAARRDKMGFPVPLAAWARGPLRELVHDLLLDGTARARGLLDPRGVETLLARESVAARHLWAILNVELWAREHAA